MIVLLKDRPEPLLRTVGSTIRAFFAALKCRGRLHGLILCANSAPALPKNAFLEADGINRVSPDAKKRFTATADGRTVYLIEGLERVRKGWSIKGR